jgi:hypothetical protein
MQLEEASIVPEGVELMAGKSLFCHGTAGKESSSERSVSMTDGETSR